MSIINVVGAKIWGGGEQYVYDICKQLQQRHRTCLLYTSKGASHNNDVYAMEQVQLSDIPVQHDSTAVSYTHLDVYKSQYWCYLW